MKNERQVELDTLRNSIIQLQEEMKENPCFSGEGIRLMREGIGVYLDEYGQGAPEVMWLGPNLRFRCRTVSLERINNGLVTSIEQTPGACNLWNSKVLPLLGVIESNLRQ